VFPWLPGRRVTPKNSLDARAHKAFIDALRRTEDIVFSKFEKRYIEWNETRDKFIENTSSHSFVLSDASTLRPIRKILKAGGTYVLGRFSSGIVVWLPSRNDE
jgi:hypothetical protein